jgi:predicted kinase
MDRRFVPVPPDLVVVTGPPASGKTTLARAISAELGWPLFEKDAVKETLFDELGTGDREWSRRLGRATAALLLLLAEVEIDAGRSAVIEANFRPAGIGDRFAGLTPRARVVQVVCSVDPVVLEERYRERAAQRHPGHLDTNAETLEAVLADVREGRYGPLPVDGPVLEVDTTSVDGDVVRDLLAAVRRVLG